jgi:hypothetical protein
MRLCSLTKFLLSPVRFTKFLGVRVPLRPPIKKALDNTISKGRAATENREDLSYNKADAQNVASYTLFKICLQ